MLESTLNRGRPRKAALAAKSIPINLRVDARLFERINAFGERSGFDSTANAMRRLLILSLDDIDAKRDAEGK